MDRDLRPSLSGWAACFVMAWLFGAAVVSAQGTGKSAPKLPNGLATPVLSTAGLAKIYKRPLLRAGRVQYCLRHLGLYEGRQSGRMTPATVKSLRRLRDDMQLKGDDVAQDWALHAVLWRQCRSAWSAAGGHLDRFGNAAFVPANTVSRPPIDLTANSVVTPVASVSGPIDAVRRVAAPPTTDASSLCLPTELRDILGRSSGPRSDIAQCELPCVNQPSNLDREDVTALEKRFGLTWCKACVSYSGQLGLEDIARIEKAGNLTLCPDVRRVGRAQAESPGVVMSDTLRGTRALFRRDVRPSDLHSAFAVVISVAGYSNGLPRRPVADRDAAGIHALLTERLGFRSNRVIELKDPTRSEFEGVFGRSGNFKSLLSERLKDAAGSPVFVFMSGLGAISGEDGEAYLLPSDAIFRRERATGYAVETLYQNLMRMGAGPVTVVLEVDFANAPSSPIMAPNAPETRVSVMPRLAIRGLTVVTASERDQRTLSDVETGLSLFTRHWIAGLSGHADLAPIGNGDGTVDSAEAFVYAAQRTGFAARKLSGVLQRPLLSQGKPLPIGRMGALVK